MGVSALVSRLKPSAESYTAVVEPEDGRNAFISQVLHEAGGRSARFSFLMPDSIREDNSIPALIDFLCFQAGEMGALNILAEIEESHILFEYLRRAGFNVYGWESIWKFTREDKLQKEKSRWHIASAKEDSAVRTLFQTLVPPLVQNAEPFSDGNTARLVYCNEKEVIAYVESISGSAGIYLKPVIHPAVEDINSLLSDLAVQFYGLGEPVYIQVRSYQAWLSEALQSIQAEPSPRFALLVKHLAAAQRSSVLQVQRAISEHRQAEPTAPIVQNMNKSDSSSRG